MQFMPSEQATLGQSTYMRVACWSENRADLARATNYLTQRMVAPTSAEWQHLDEIGRYVPLRLDGQLGTAAISVRSFDQRRQ